MHHKAQLHHTINIPIKYDNKHYNKQALNKELHNLSMPLKWPN